MCRFCDKFTGNCLDRKDRAQADLFEGSSDRYELFVTPTADDEHECYLILLDNKDNESCDSVKINFCPVCGRKLSEDVCGSQQS